MKVLLCTGRYYMGGIEKYVRDLAIELSKKKNEVKILVFFYIKSNDIDDFKSHGIEVIELKGNNGRSLIMLYKYFKTLRQFKPDIVHLNILPLLGSIVHMFYRKPIIVYTIHQMDYISAYDLFYRPIIKGVIAVSEKVKSHLQSHNFLNKSLWEVIYNGIQNNNPYKIKDYIKGDSVNLIMVSRLAQDKQPHYAIEILNYLNTNSDISYTLTFVGAPDVDDKQYIEKINKKILEYNLSDKVFFEGWQNEIFKYLINAQGFLMLSQKESFGYNVLEAMSVGLPIFSFDVEGGLSELHENNFTGIMIDDPICLAKEIDNVFKTERWKIYSENAFQSSKKFSISSMTDKTIEFYQEVLKKNNV
ncbi:glycosyltransferase family 4 protein [Chryseobacterium aquaticum]|uniref:Glycosyltransferase family 4 protein n=1 Tax=Chryseobacterium aquaticum TaxID=452084 RepID=A0A848N5X3_9FLAO|nr:MULTISPECIES: glycosyltransferase family 4 protein [Chryseobacterium]NMR35786.1 glycosyltransferase family 4 protein [Chryseobacterium aquaticum]NRQ47767.1 glycosyltransferase family 4 protein [Chryseobacterium sp. C-204]